MKGGLTCFSMGPLTLPGFRLASDAFRLCKAVTAPGLLHISCAYFKAGHLGVCPKMCVVVRTGGREWGWARVVEDQKVSVGASEAKPRPKTPKLAPPPRAAFVTEAVLRSFQRQYLWQRQLLKSAARSSSGHLTALPGSARWFGCVSLALMARWRDRDEVGSGVSRGKRPLHRHVPGIGLRWTRRAAIIRCWFLTCGRQPRRSSERRARLPHPDQTAR